MQKSKLTLNNVGDSVVTMMQREARSSVHITLDTIHKYIFVGVNDTSSAENTENSTIKSATNSCSLG